MSTGKDEAVEIKEELWNSFFAGERLACSRLITLADNYPEAIPQIRHKLIPHQKHAVRIGITGPPGVGKSTVTSSLARRAAIEGKSVGVIAVDPTSPFTGGAFLGDRVRMQNLIGMKNVFIRSLASRDGTGGLSPAAPYAADIFDAFGMEWILIETLGVGQAELDVLNCADFVILVLQPGAGDVIQALKTGILETGDMFLINKADLHGADNLMDSLNFMFDAGLGCHEHERPPILTSSADREEGMEDVYRHLSEKVRELKISDRLLEKRIARIDAEVRNNIRKSLWKRFIDVTSSEADIRKAAAELAEKGKSPYPFIEELMSRVEIILSKRVESK